MKILNQLFEDNFSSQEREKIRRKAGEKIAAVLRLRQVRQAQHVTQKTLAQAMGLSQSALSELERRPNITLETLQRHIKAIGGQLEIKAVFQVI